MMAKPIAKRLANAASSAVVLSGKDMGNIIPTEIKPKATPAIRPWPKLDIFLHRRFPQFDPVSLGIHQPPKLSKLRLLRFLLDFHAFAAQLT